MQPYAAFTLNDFDDQERNLTFVKTDFQVFKTTSFKTRGGTLIGRKSIV